MKRKQYIPWNIFWKCDSHMWAKRRKKSWDVAGNEILVGVDIMSWRFTFSWRTIFQGMFDMFFALVWLYYPTLLTVNHLPQNFCQSANINLYTNLFVLVIFNLKPTWCSTLYATLTVKGRYFTLLYI